MLKKIIILIASLILIMLSLSNIAGAQEKVSKEKRLSRYINHGNGTITDTKTGLMWASKDNGSRVNWWDARAFCQKYNGGGHTDWRMPKLKELAMLYDQNKSGLYHITPLIELSDQYIWAAETFGSSGAPFTFIYGRRGWLDDFLSDGGRALPVRDEK